MSLVGPRPERPEFVVALEKIVPRYRERLGVRPGLTGLAQVQLPPDTDVASVQRKLAHDLYYLENFSFFLEVRILAATVFLVLGMPYSIWRALLKLPDSGKVERAYRRSIRSIGDNNTFEESSSLPPLCLDATVTLEPA